MEAKSDSNPQWCLDTVCYRTKGHEGKHMSLFECSVTWPEDVYTGGYGPGAEVYSDLEAKPNSDGAIKHDYKKPDLSLLAYIPADALTEVGYVILYGAGKYGMNNWRKGMQWTRLVSAALRHIWAWMRGTDDDEESMRNHLAHAVCCLLFLLEYQKLKLGVDNRATNSKDEVPF